MTTTSETLQHAAHVGRITLTHADTEPHPQMPPNGATTWWADGTTSYVLHFRSGHVHGWTLADETDTVIQTVDSIRAGEDMAPDRLRSALRDVRRLRTRLEAVEAELILYARENGAQGRPRLPLRDIGEELGLHHTTVAERHGRLAAGEAPQWRNWLVQHTDRAGMYGPPDTVTPVRVNVTAWDRGQDPAAPLCGELHDDGTTACGRPALHHAVPGDETGHQDHNGRRWDA